MSTAVLVPLIGGTAAAIVLPFVSSAVCHAAWGSEGVVFLDHPSSAHLQAAMLLSAVELARRVEGFCYRLFDKFRDDKYLVGRRLINFHPR